VFGLAFQAELIVLALAIAASFQLTSRRYPCCDQILQSSSFTKPRRKPIPITLSSALTLLILLTIFILLLHPKSNTTASTRQQQNV